VLRGRLRRCGGDQKHTERGPEPGYLDRVTWRDRWINTFHCKPDVVCSSLGYRSRSGKDLHDE
jgi:hypothetical protein